MIENINDKTVTVKLTRGELCRLLIFLAGNMFDNTGNPRTTLLKIHDNLHDQLEAFDKKNGIGQINKGGEKQ